jgi:hypothetical protein
LVEFSADVDISSGCIHATPGDKTALDELVGISTQNFSVFACSRFALVCVDDEVSWSVIDFRSTKPRLEDGFVSPRVLLPVGFVHKAPFQSTRETSTSPPSQARVLDGLNNPGIAF